MQTQPSRKPAPRKQAGGSPYLRALPAFLAFSALALTLSYFAQTRWLPNGWLPDAQNAAAVSVAEVHTTSDVRVCEVMASNRAALADDTGEYPDWVEIGNFGASPADITGWVLTDSASKQVRFSFPSLVLQPGERVIVFASGHLRADAGGTFHAPFRLSSSGDAVMLFDENENIVESFNLPSLGPDMSYARSEDGSTWTITGEYTPGLANTSENHALLTERAPENPSGVVINEVLADNETGIALEDGTRPDWIELYNAGSTSEDISGFSLTDDAAKPKKWVIPEGTVLEPGECLLVYATGETRDGLFASFRLSAEGETVRLYDVSGYLVSEAAFDNLASDASLARRASGDYSVTRAPTPGAENTFTD